MTPITAVLRYMRDLASADQIDSKAKLLIQLLIGMQKLKEKSIPGTEQLTTEILTTLGLQTHSLLDESVCFGTLDELASTINPDFLEDIQINDKTEADAIVTKLLVDYGLNERNYNGEYNDMLAVHFQEKLFDGVKMMDLFQGTNLYSLRDIRKHLDAIYVQDTKRSNDQIFYCLARKNHAKYIGVDDPTYMDFGMHYLIAKYEELYGKEYEGDKAFEDSELHRFFFNTTMEVLFPVESRTSTDEQLIQELLAIDKLTDDVIKRQILQEGKIQDISVTDIAVWRCNLREDKLRDLLGVRTDAQLDDKYRNLLEKCSSSDTFETRDLTN